MKSIVLAGCRVRYTIRFSRAARRSRIRVNGAGVQVVLPASAAEDQAAAFLQRNASWVLSQLAFAQRVRSVRAQPAARSDTVLLRGQRTRVERIEDDSARRFGIVEAQGGRIRVRIARSNGFDATRTLELWLRRQARSDIEERLRQRATEMRQHPGRLYVMGQRTKWGGCSRRRNLSFNWRLVMAPPSVLDYIVVHELAHLVEPHHSTRFWLIVRSYCPGYARHKTWLREHEELLLASPIAPTTKISGT